jgi:MFS transporter, FHS family, L-fucose permease
MALAPSITASPDDSAAGADAPADLRWFIFALFFIFGGITSLNDILIPKLKHMFTLTHTQAMFVQFAFFIAYFLVSLPAAMVVKKFGYLRSATIGLVVMTLGCVLFIPASMSGAFIGFLLALFVLASGITLVQVVSNPLISLLGTPSTAHSRLTFAQAFNSLGTTVFPFVGARLILAPLERIDTATLDAAAAKLAETQVIIHTYLGLAAALLVVALAVWSRRNRLVQAPASDTNLLHAFGLFRRPRFAFGTLGIFLYVGAEVAIGSNLVAWLTQPGVLGIADREAGELVALYWGGAMVGRFLGAAMLRKFPPPLMLAGAGIGAATLVAIAATSSGTIAAYSLLAVGLMNSIMFPTIFSLACEGLGDRTPDGSGLLCLAIVGGAIVPLILGVAADSSGLAFALMVPIACYIGIIAFARYCRAHPVIG